MAESNRLVDLVQEGIDQFLDARAPQLEQIAPETLPFIEYSRDLLRGGKRFRALFCYWGWAAVSFRAAHDVPMSSETDARTDAIVAAAVALELFHAAALVHDDIIDNSDTRRGNASAHRRFESAHGQNQWTGAADTFGRSAATLLGDLLLAWSDEAFDEALQLTDDEPARLTARREFNTMRTQVMLGQYLDILEEQSWRSHPEADQLSRARRIVIYKSAKYSVEAPLTIGAALGGADDAALSELRAFGLPLGIAFQLRDDLLGVFGDSQVTGKPSGDDLREGKRTVLVAIARSRLPANARSLVDELLGDPHLTDMQVRMLQDTLRECGAVDVVEDIIQREVERAAESIRMANIAKTARNQLLGLIDNVISRTS